MNAINKNLPTWDLTDLYNDLKDPNIRRDLDDAKSRSQAFQQTYQGKLDGLSGDELADAIAEYEAISEICGKIGSFAQLMYAGDSSDAAIGQFYQFVQEEMTGISSLSLFFGLEINRIEDASLDAKYEQSAALRRYRPWLDENRAFRRISYRTRSNRFCMNAALPDRPPGCVCLTRPWPSCAFRLMAKN